MTKLQNIRAALALLFALFAAMLPTDGALAQTVTQAPQFITPNALTDLGNGPLEIKMITGVANIGTSLGTGTGGNGGVSGSTVTLTATPSTPPCVGCIISGTGITSGTTVTAFNGTTTVTLSANMSVANGTALAWGAACPTSPPPVSFAVMPLRTLTNATDFPFYTQARLCAYGTNGPGAQILTFPIGAH